MPTTKPRPAGNLPDELTSFVGRRQLAADVKLALSASRLVTLTGPGGVGKSRLAVHVARDLRRAFPDGICFVELAAVQDPALVPRAVAAALGLLETSAREPEDSLASYLAESAALIVLDNCEHVLEGAARLAALLLTAAGGLRLLATSRAPLAIGAEQILPVPPLSLPPAPGRPALGMPGQHEALALFEDRARAVLPGFRLGPQNQETVTRLCQRLDGVPLAIELAAVRVRILSPEQILDRLEDRFRLLTDGRRDGPPRHQTLRAAVEWSFGLCSDTEQLLWERCSVFAGGFDLDAAENICAGDGLAAADVLGVVARLVDQSVLARDGDAGERPGTGCWKPSGNSARNGWRAPGRAASCDGGTGTTTCGWPNSPMRSPAGRVRTSGLSACRRNGPTSGLRLTTACPLPARPARASGWRRRRGFTGSAAASSGTGATGSAAPSPPTRCRPATGPGHCGRRAGSRSCRASRPTSTALLEQARELAIDLEDGNALSYAMLFLGNTAAFGARVQKGLALLEEARARLSRSGQWTAPGLIVFAASVQAESLLGRMDRAVALQDECQAICDSLGERWVLSWLNWNLGVGWWSGRRQAEGGS